MFDLGTRILVVDDMAIVRRVASRLLKEMGFQQVETANDGAEAWELIRASSPPFGLVLSDWNMPNTSGLDLLKRVRADGRLAKLPFVLITAESDREQILAAVNAGVSDYILKPFTAESIRAKLETVYQKVSGG